MHSTETCTRDRIERIAAALLENHYDTCAGNVKRARDAIPTIVDIAAELVEYMDQRTPLKANGDQCLDAMPRYWHSSHEVLVFKDEQARKP